MRSFYLKLLLFFPFLFSSPLFSWGLLQGKVASEHADERNQFVRSLYRVYDPFYLGPLLAPGAHTVPKRAWNIQPYFDIQRNYGVYNADWRLIRSSSSMKFTYLSAIQYGLTDFLDANISVQMFTNRNGNQSTFGYGDTPLAIGLQLLEGEVGTWIPSCKASFSINIPTGKYKHGSQSKLGTDMMGSGLFSPQISINFQKSFNTLFKKNINTNDYHPFRFRWSFSYQLNPSVYVSGFNTYGGNSLTRGRVTPGNNFSTIFAWEYSLNKNWVFATDWLYTVTAPSRFKGVTGGATVGGPGNQNFSVAPALEYSINSKFGVLAGVQLSLTGRNSSAFTTGLFSFTWLF